MITGLRIKNLGCFDDYNYSVKFNKLNIIVGPNNSGKSTLFKALNFIRSFSFFSSLQWNNAYYTLDNLSDSIYNHDQNRELSIEVDYQQSTGVILTARLGLKGNGSFTKGDIVVLPTGRLNSRLQGSNELTRSVWYFTPNRSLVSSRTQVGTKHDQMQPLSPSGSDITQFYIERWTSQDQNWSLAQEWIKKIDPQSVLLSTPLIANQVSIETRRNDGKTTTSVNLSLQGNGMQNAATIIAGVIFSPENSTIIIEEPENYLNSRSVEYLVDLFNYAVNNMNKQIIITTHSWEILNAYCSDIGEGKDRGNIHVKTKPEDFKLIVLTEKLGAEKILEYDLKNKKYADVRTYFKQLWG